MRAYVGVDWSATKVVCSSALAGGKPRRINGAGPVLDEVSDLVQRVRKRHKEATEVHILIEAGALGWVKMFAAAGAVVHVADARQAKKFAESLRSSGAKSDGADSATLTYMAQSPAHCPEPWEPQPELEPLRRLGAAHEQLTRERTRIQQQIRALLQENMPLVSKALTVLESRWAIAFLRRVPTPWHATDIDEDLLRELTPKVRKHRRQALVDALKRTEAPWMSDGLARIEARRVRHLLDRLELVVKQVREVEQDLDESTAELDTRKLLETVDGIGMRQATTLIEFAFGSTLAHRDQAGIQLGACPVFRGSGETPQGRPRGYSRMRRAANFRAKRATYLLGRLAQQHLPWARAMYLAARAKGQSAATAYRRIARSLLRILTAMVRTNQPYDEARYVAALQANGVDWAMQL